MSDSTIKVSKEEQEPTFRTKFRTVKIDRESKNRSGAYGVYPYHMSQQSLLDNVHTWSRDECRSQLSFAVPKLVHYLQGANDLGRAAEIIHLICSSFLPVVAKGQAESIVFSNVAHKAAECVENSLNKAQDLAVQTNQDLQQTGQDISNLVQVCLDVIGCLGMCIGRMVEEAGAVPVSSIHSLSASVLHVIERSYTHCKRSSEIYGALLELVSQKLTSLFRHANELQSAFIGLAEKLEPSGRNLDQDIQDIAIVIHGLFEISQVVATLEIKVTLTLWKAISRISCQHKSIISDRLEIDLMLSSLSSNMSSTYLYMFNLPNHKDIERTTVNKTCKILGFQMRVLQMLLKEFSSQTGSSCPDIYRLLLVIMSQLPPCLGARHVPDYVADEIERQILVGLSPVVSYLVTSKDLVRAVTNPEESGSQEEDGLPKLLLLLTILDCLQKSPDEVLSIWFDTQDGKGIFPAIFHAISTCHAEMNLPVTFPGMKSTDSPARVSLYEQVVTKLSAFVASLPAAHFSRLESCLLSNVLGRQILQANVAMDVWCFIARYSTPELCQSHCWLLAHLIDETGLGVSPQCSHLVQLLRRLLRFLAPEHQAEFIKEFPVEQHLELWSVIPLAIFTPSHLQSLVGNILGLTLSRLDSWCSEEPRTATSCNHTIASLLCLVNLCASTGVMESHLTDDHRQSIHATCIKLWGMVTPQSILQALPWAYTKALFKLTSYLTPYMDNKNLLNILRLGSSLLTKDAAVDVKLAVLSFLTAASRNKIQPNSEQCQVFEELSKLFNAFLKEGNPALHQVGLEAFANFAEETPYESVVTDSLENNSRLQEKVIGFLREAGETTSRERPVETPIEELKYQAKCSEELAKLPADRLYPRPYIPPEPGQPEPIDNMDECTSSLENLRLGVNNLTTLRSNGPLPDWVREELNIIHLQLTELL